jgi:chromosome segregation ATPase
VGGCARQLTSFRLTTAERAWYRAVMTTTTTPGKSLSSFARAALALDAEFSKFARLSEELERLQVGSDRGLDRAQALLAELAECRERFGPASEELARSLEEARQRTAHAAEQVAGRESAVRDRQAHVEQLVGRYKTLGEMVARVQELAGALRKSGSAGLDQAVTSKLPELDAQLALLVEEARKLMQEAHAANMKALERNADSLRQSLQTVRNKFGMMAPKAPATPPPS